MGASSIANDVEGQTATETLTATRAWRIALVAGQLALVALVVRGLELESRGLYLVLLLALGGFVVNALLPLRWRLPFFALLSAAGVLVALSLQGLWVLAIGLVLIGVCHLPVAWAVRVSLLVTLAVGLGFLRAGAVASPIPVTVWPILGSMFIFRLALYLYSLKHEGPPRNLWGTVAYLFMVPNASFPLFPIVDYKTFLRSHYDAPEGPVYARGCQWMVRGLWHLLLYRVIYHFWVIDPSHVESLSGVVQFSMQAYLLYLRVSGQFHLIVGLLHLFGFRLPETHHLYYLASSFTDLWRRINIYWKDFMMKLVYYPSFFRLRKLGNRTGVLASTAIVMFLTWLLHAYQKFWIVGNDPFTRVDTIFWFVLGLLVLGSTVYEQYQPKGARPRAGGWNLRKALGTVMVFGTMAIMWTFWNADSPGEFVRVMSLARNVDAAGIAMLVALVGGGLFVSGWPWGAMTLAKLEERERPLAADFRDGAIRAGMMGVMLVAARPATHATLGQELGSVVSRVTSGALNERDRTLQVRGYYEDLSNSARPSSQLWEMETERPKDWVNLEMTEAYRLLDNFLYEELHPNVSITFKRAPFRTNMHGLHDRDYTRAKPEGTYRIAIFGASQVLAGGVPDELTFENILEDSLNARFGKRHRIEVLNFGMAAASILQEMELVRQRGMQFDPDLVLLTSVPPDDMLLTRHLWVLWRENVPIPYEGLRLAGEAAGLDSTMDKATVTRRLFPILDSLKRSAVDRVDSLVRAAGGRAGLVLMRLPTVPNDSARTIAARAAELGWPVMDISEPFPAGEDEARYRLTSFDNHYNIEGNQLIARALLREILRKADHLGLHDGPAPASPAASAGGATP